MFLLVVRARAGEFGLKVPCNDQSTLPGVKTPCQHRLAMASNPLAMASNLRAMASIVVVFGLLGRWVCQILAGQEHPSSNCRGRWSDMQADASCEIAMCTTVLPDICR